MRFFIAAVLSSTILAAPANAEWWEAETDHFIVYSESSQADAKKFAEKMEQLDMSLRSLQNVKFAPANSDSQKLTVFRFGQTSDIGRLAGSSGVAGFYIPRLGGSVSFTPIRGDSRGTGQLLGARGESEKKKLDPEKVLFHEYTHHFMFQHFEAAYPKWYSEGFAETVATIRMNPDGTFHIGDPPNYRSDLLFQSMLNVSAERMLTAPNKPTGEDVMGWYSIGWLLNHYLTFDPSRQGQLKQYLRAVNSGTKKDDAARQAFGDLGKLDREITKYKSSGKLAGIDVKIANFRPPVAQMRKLAADEEAVMKVRIRSSAGVNKKLAPDAARDARAVAAKYPQSHAAQLALAEAELDLGTFEPASLVAAEAAADRALAIKPDSVEALIFKGRALYERGKTQKALLPTARSWFTKAYNVDPHHPAPLFYNYLTYYESGAAIPESAIIGLETAYDKALYDHQLKLVLARQLLSEKKGPAARKILMPIAIFPEFGDSPKKYTEVTDLIAAGKVDEAYKLLVATMAEDERKAKTGDDD